MTGNDYALEFITGPLIAPTRVTGFGGAWSAAAESVDGGPVNAAAPAVREPFSFDWFDYDLNLDISFPGAYGGTDFDNRGQRANQDTVVTVNSFLYLNLGAQLQFGELGTSVNAEFLQYSIAPPGASSPNSPGLDLTLGRYHALGAYGLAGNQVVVGAGLRGVTAQVAQTGGGQSGRTLLTMTGASPEVGIIVKPDNLPWRVGLTARAPVSGRSFGSAAVQADPNGIARAGQFILPSKVVLPWELEAGVALQLGPRPLNPRWINPHEVERPLEGRTQILRQARAYEQARELARLPPDARTARKDEMVREEAAIREIEDAHTAAESQRLRDVRKARYDNWPRERLLILASVLVAGPSESAVGMEGFLEQRLDYVGRTASVTPHLGFESEPIVNFLRARVGSYLEPSRFTDGNARQHFTFGADFRLFPWSGWGLFGDQVWRASFCADLGPRYANWGFGVAAWH